jgi:sugar phosphate isomerase/epimerase
MFDAWSVVQHGTDLYSWAKRMAPRMAQTTVADYVELPRYHLATALSSYEQLPPYLRAVPVGQGFIDYAGFFRGLCEGGFDGTVSYEMCSPVKGGGSLQNLDATAKASLEAIHCLIAGEC